MALHIVTLQHYVQIHLLLYLLLNYSRYLFLSFNDCCIEYRDY